MIYMYEVKSQRKCLHLCRSTEKKSITICDLIWASGTVYLPVANSVPFAAPNVEQAMEIGIIHDTDPRARLPHV